jgi:hypothetical protein
MNSNLLIRYGLIAGGLLTVLLFAPILIFGPAPEYMRWGEVFGYAAMLLAMTATAFAIRAERDRAGRISFSRAFLIGCGVSALAGLIFGLGTWFFYALYGDALPEALYEFYRQNAAGDPHQLAQIEANKAWFFNRPLQAAVMFATVFLIGVVESLIAAIWFSRRRLRAA